MNPHLVVIDPAGKVLDCALDSMMPVGRVAAKYPDAWVKVIDREGCPICQEDVRRGLSARLRPGDRLEHKGGFRFDLVPLLSDESERGIDRILCESTGVLDTPNFRADLALRCQMVVERDRPDLEVVFDTDRPGVLAGRFKYRTGKETTHERE